MTHHDSRRTYRFSRKPCRQSTGIDKQKTSWSSRPDTPYESIPSTSLENSAEIVSKYPGVSCSCFSFSGICHNIDTCWWWWSCRWRGWRSLRASDADHRSVKVYLGYWGDFLISLSCITCTRSWLYDGGFRAINHLSSFSQSERFKQNLARKYQRQSSRNAWHTG